MDHARPSPTGARRRHSNPFALRPSIQRNCRRCHLPLGSPLDHCWTCDKSSAGIRWARLAVQVTVVLALVAGVVLFGMG